MSEVVQVNEGYYRFNVGETASSIARRVYGDVHKASALLRANEEDWEDLEQVVVPNKKGRVTQVQEGESVQRIIARMFPNQPVSIYMQPFFLWNGGEHIKLLPGDSVYVPER